MVRERSRVRIPIQAQRKRILVCRVWGNWLVFDFLNWRLPGSFIEQSVSVLIGEVGVRIPIWGYM